MEDWHIPEAVPARAYVDGHEVHHLAAAVVRRGWWCGLAFAALQAIGFIYALVQTPVTGRLVAGGIGELALILVLTEGVRRWNLVAAVLLACDPFFETVWYFWRAGPNADGIHDAPALPLPMVILFLVPISVFLGRAAIQIHHVRRGIAALQRR
jgi:hypothetical protein